MKKIKNFNPQRGYYFPMFPIILSKDDAIIDGQNRYALCEMNGLKFQTIKLPFTVDQINTKSCIEELNKIQKKQDEQLEQAFIKYRIDFKTQLIHCSSQMKIKKFCQFKDLFESDDEYWTELRTAFMCSKNTRNYQKEIRELFSAKKENRIKLMTDTEIKELEELPAKIKVYRGMTEEEKDSGEYGISWSLKKEVAETFAFTYAHNYDSVGKPKTVLELKINKSDVIAYLTDRQENEILYLHN